MTETEPAQPLNMLSLIVPDEVAIGFFTAVVVGQSTAILMLWNKYTDCVSDRVRIREKLNERQPEP